jgi:hypothetical protein
MPRGIYAKNYYPSHPKGVPFTISPMEIRRYLKFKYIGNEDKTMLVCDVCKEPIVSGQIVVSFNYFLVHYNICYDQKIRDVKDEELTGEELEWIETGVWKDKEGD